MDQISTSFRLKSLQSCTCWRLVLDVPSCLFLPHSKKLGRLLFQHSKEDIGLRLRPRPQVLPEPAEQYERQRVAG